MGGRKVSRQTNGGVLSNAMTQLGLAITFLTTAILVIGFFRHRQRRLAFYGLAGLVELLSAEILVFAGIQPVAIYSTPIVWTCYILLADATVLAMRGHSRLHDAAVCRGCTTLNSTLVGF